jgi:MoaA/NifB/PqqE/SkfB family radical SAM enzyme
MQSAHFVQIEPVGPRPGPHAINDGAEHALPNMDFHLFCRLVDQLPEMTDLRLQGRGEPLLHLHLFDMVRYAVERGMLVSMTTGLTALSERLAEECVHSGLYRIHVVIDAATSPLTTSDPIQPRHLRVLRNLRRLIAARDRTEHAQPVIALTAVLHHSDLPRLPALVRFAHDEGIADMTVEIADGGPGGAGSALQSLRQRRMFSAAQRLAHALGVTLHPLRFTRDDLAGSAPGNACIGYNGEPCSCEVLPERRLHLVESRSALPDASSQSSMPQLPRGAAL